MGVKRALVAGTNIREALCNTMEDDRMALDTRQDDRLT